MIVMAFEDETPWVSVEITFKNQHHLFCSQYISNYMALFMTNNKTYTIQNVNVQCIRQRISIFSTNAL